MRKEGRRREEEKRSVEENLRECDSRDGGRAEMRARKEILIEGAIIRLAEDLSTV